MNNKFDFDGIKTNFEKWWHGEDIGRPLMRVIANDNQTPYQGSYSDFEDMHMGVDYNYKKSMHKITNSCFYADAYPAIDLNIGPGSLATYLGSKPVFSEGTVWFTPCIEDYDGYKIEYDPENIWLNKHLNAVKALKDKACGEYVVNIPDIIENIDILAAMRDPFKLLYDLMDCPEKVKQFTNDIDGTYFDVYDRFYELLKDDDGGSSYTSFSVYGRGKTAKVQCDFCSMISPDDFREFVKPNLETQCSKLDYSIYHLDGPDCICHVPALMEIESLNALQWTPSYKQEDCANSRWYQIYKQVRDAGKSMHVYIYDGGFEGWVESSKRFVNKFGREGVYFLYPVMTNEQAKRLVELSYKW